MAKNCCPSTDEVQLNPAFRRQRQPQPALNFIGLNLLPQHPLCEVTTCIATHDGVALSRQRFLRYPPGGGTPRRE
ncbi:hypothetical protein E4U54_005322 [Claviceps lovelessii]|nr:hypothetical protein E4U54_005322 [Claviceps lovelessii]